VSYDIWTFPKALYPRTHQRNEKRVEVEPRSHDCNHMLVSIKQRFNPLGQATLPTKFKWCHEQKI